MKGECVPNTAVLAPQGTHPNTAIAGEGMGHRLLGVDRAGLGPLWPCSTCHT